MKTKSLPGRFRPTTKMEWRRLRAGGGEWWVVLLAERDGGRLIDACQIRLDDWFALEALEYAVGELESVRLARYRSALETIAKMRREVVEAEGLARECKTHPGLNIAVTIAEAALAGKLELMTNPGD